MAPTTPLLSTEERAELRQLLNREAWRRGNLRHLLHPDQKLAYDRIKVSTGRFILEIARRWGKTTLLMLLAFEVCLRAAGRRVVYGAPTYRALREFVLPVVEKLAALAPTEYRPRFNATTGHVTFPHNGSYVALFGAQDKKAADRGRGPEAEAAFLDEAGFTPVLMYVLRSIFGPQLLHTGGRTILGSTPAPLPDHDFTVLAERAELTGNFLRRSVFQNPMLTAEQLRAFIEQDARDEGLTPEDYQLTDTFRREYLAERVIDRLLVVVPEWGAINETTKRPNSESCIGIVERPEFYDGNTWLDFGGADPHAATFGYWHFRQAKYVVEDEALLRGGENTEQLARVVKQKETALWGVNRWEGTLRGAADPQLLAVLPDWMREAIDEDAPQQPYSRVADNDLQLIRDLYELHGLAFAPTEKHQKDLAVNNVRVMVSAHQLLIHPRCVHTIRHIGTTTWANNRRQTYARRGGQHGDLLDTIVYGVRNLSRRNPEPAHLGLSPGQSARVRLLQQQEEEEQAEVMLGSSALAKRLLGKRQ